MFAPRNGSWPLRARRNVLICFRIRMSSVFTLGLRLLRGHPTPSALHGGVAPKGCAIHGSVGAYQGRLFHVPRKKQRPLEPSSIRGGKGIAHACPSFCYDSFRERLRITQWPCGSRGTKSSFSYIAVGNGCGLSILILRSLNPSLLPAPVNHLSSTVVKWRRPVA